MSEPEELPVVIQKPPMSREETVAIERPELRRRLADAASQREPLRSILFIGILEHNRCFALLTQEECFALAYRGRGAYSFWESRFQKPLSVNRFVHILALTRPDKQFDVQEMALRKALLDAYQMDEPWFRGKTSSLQTAQFGHQIHGDEVKVVPRAAAEWLLRTSEWLIPQSLATFLEGRGVVVEVADPGNELIGMSRIISGASVDRAFKELCRGRSDTPPTRREIDAWAKQHNFSTSQARKLHQGLCNKRGRRRSQKNGQQ